ncbi:hypothetical protein J6590_089522 [Homalodisca vitripennis]|nr:hypothetical protein J6590_089522 [Homalodisca vitripennis]
MEGAGVGGVCRMSVGGGPLATSNSFEVLGERHNLESLNDFPPLTGKRKGDWGGRRWEKFVLLRIIRSLVILSCPWLTAGAVTGKAEASDYLVMVGGTNFATEESVQRLGPGLDALAQGMQGRVVWVETPYRYDLPQHNNLLRKQNEVLKEKCTKYKWAFLGINSLMDRSCCTRHGLHLNWREKDVLSGVIESYIACVDPLVQQSACTKNLKECSKPNQT